MRIASWNIDSVRARMALIEDWLDVNQPDVLCLQETKVADRSFPTAPFVRRGFEVAMAGGGGHGGGGQGGVAMMSRLGLVDVVRGIPGAKPPLGERRTISATVGSMRLHTVYAPNGRKVGTRAHDVKLAWLELFRAWVAMDGFDGGTPTVVLGDLNIAPCDIDVWDASRYRKRNLTSPPERAAFERFRSMGLVDVVRQHHGERPVFTWWNRRGDFYETDRGWRLDHVLADAETAKSVSGVWVDREERGRVGSSDHAPLVVEFDR